HRPGQPPLAEGGRAAGIGQSRAGPDAGPLRGPSRGHLGPDPGRVAGAGAPLGSSDADGRGQAASARSRKLSFMALTQPVKVSVRAASPAKSAAEAAGPEPARAMRRASGARARSTKLV